MSDKGGSMKQAYTVLSDVSGTFGGEGYEYAAGPVTVSSHKEAQVLELLVTLGVAKRGKNRE